MTDLYRTTVPTPLGTLNLVASDAGLREIRLPLPGERMTPVVPARANAVTDEAARQLTEYFAGTRTMFDVPLDIATGTAFQRSVWAALAQIPYGETHTYGQVAAALGVPGAARAVGGANSRNPLPIVVPCHRVVGADGSMTGYGGSSPEGIAFKRHLLDLEGARIG